MTIVIDHIEDGVEEIIGDKINIIIGMVGNIEIIQHHDLNIGTGKTLHHNDPWELDMNGMTTSHDDNKSIHIMAGLARPRSSAATRGKHKDGGRLTKVYLNIHYMSNLYIAISSSTSSKTSALFVTLRPSS